VLVIRASRLFPGESLSGDSEQDEAFRRSPPVASQASWTAARGVGQ
jgi:hypothetical protein